MPGGGAVVGNSKGFPEKSVVLWWVLSTVLASTEATVPCHWLLLKKKSGCHTGADELLGGGDSVFSHRLRSTECSDRKIESMD